MNQSGEPALGGGAARVQLGALTGSRFRPTMAQERSAAPEPARGGPLWMLDEPVF